MRELFDFLGITEHIILHVSLLHKEKERVFTDPLPYFLRLSALEFLARPILTLSYSNYREVIFLSKPVSIPTYLVSILKAQGLGVPRQLFLFNEPLQKFISTAIKLISFFQSQLAFVSIIHGISNELNVRVV